ncbi:MAG: DNA polymerase III subunit chi [Rhodanobacteraceae bacterium]|nr:DNA polymerase III subunit chi [Rhodanobacteraceae bacterium]
MPRADFYLIDKPKYREQPLRVVCVLAKRAYAAEIPTLILARTLDEAEALDDLLWSFEPDAFIPHQIAGDEEDDYTAVLIAPPGAQVADRPLVINLREECAPGSYETVKEVVAADPAERDGSRKRWAEYRKRGFEVQKFDL